MGVVDLRRRLTSDEVAYRAALRSDCSLILVNPPVQANLIEAGSIDLSVGTRFFDSDRGQPHTIPAEGITLRPRQAVVVYTHEKVCLSYNVFGLLSGKGTLIYNGVFISQGKIDPGFQDNLRIGLLNGGKRPLQLTPGSPICSCTFFQMETHLDDPLARHGSEPAKQYTPTVGQRFRAFMRDNWKWMVTTVIAAIGAAVGAAKLTQ